MKRALPLLCLFAALGLAATGYSLLRADAGTAIAVPSGVPAGAADPSALRAALHAARRTCSIAALDQFVAEHRARCEAQPGDAEAWHLLALAHLERALLRSHDRGLRAGEPTFPSLPAELVADLDAGLVAVARARELGDGTGDLFRIEAGLMSQRITGLASALQWNGRIQEALRQASEIAPDNPHLHVALGLRKLLAPRWLGQDPTQALAHFEFAAKALPDDERPAVFAAMASWLQRQGQAAIAWLEQASARNPANRFARAVLARLRAGEDDPFGRDLTPADGGRR
jgi:tetratricopeptide (TPR) repeat protein